MTTTFLDLSHTTIRVLDAYKSLLEKDNKYPSYAEVAKEAGMTSAGVAKHVPILIEKGYATKRPGTWRNIVITEKQS